MRCINKGNSKTLIFLGKVILVFAAGSIFFHIIVMLIDYFLMIKPLNLNLHENFSNILFSIPMIPMLVAYGLLSLGIYYLWEKNKKTVLFAREKEIQSENVETVLKSMQRLTGMLAEQIGSQNSKIMSWIESRKRLGHPVPTKVEKSNKQIARAIQSLSEISFVIPYTEGRPINAADIEKILKDQLFDITGFQAKKEHPLEPEEIINN